MKQVLVLCILGLLAGACSKFKTSDGELQTGTWRAVLSTQGQEVPFLLEVEKDSAGQFQAFIINADERLLLDEFRFANDSVTIPLHIFDASIVARVSGDEMNGTFIKHFDKDYRISFSAKHGINERFANMNNGLPTVDFSGKYRVSFLENNGDTSKAIGVFTQKGTRITGSFLTTTGDYRYLDGNVSHDSLRLSSFDGNNVYLVTGKGTADAFEGRFYSGKTRNVRWTAVKDENASLPSAESLTYLREGYDRIEFSFLDVNGKTIALSDDKYKDKVVIVQIFGTWCPNCMDETKFLAPWYDENKSRGVEIVGLAYERKDDFNYASERVKKMIDRFDVHYDFAIAGTNDKQKAAETLPMLNSIIAFPTTIFIGKDGKVRKIHTGFSGPGTGVFYDQFIEEFNQTIDKLLAEPAGPAS